VITAERPPAARLNGRIKLVFKSNGRGTSLARSHVAAPLKIVRPFALNDGRALVQVLTLGPGLCGGDCCTLDVTVEPGARAVVIMQTASRILGMSDGASATQRVNLVVGTGAQLEYYPGLTIPFAGSCLKQSVTARADRDSRLGILETWAMGRTSRGEYLRFRHLSSRTIVSIDDRPVFADALEIEPALTNAAATGCLENHHYVASGFWHGVPDDAPITPPSSGALLAFDRSSSREQVFLRALADDGYEIATTLQSAADAIGLAWGCEPIPLKRFVS
jgi:urease accessory protein